MGMLHVQDEHLSLQKKLAHIQQHVHCSSVHCSSVHRRVYPRGQQLAG